MQEWLLNGGHYLCQPTKLITMKRQIQNWLFRQIHTNNLIYNTCWEDPRCDRELLQFDHQSEIVMITSAGCNALSYLLDNPKQIHCVDMNPRQNALLELKKAFYQAGDYDTFFECLGTGKTYNIKPFYQNQLRQHLPEFAQKYWDKHTHYFSGKGLRKSFYFHGTSGFLAWSIGLYFKAKKQLKATIEQFFQAPTIEQQARIYQVIDEQFYSRFLVWFINRHAVMSLAGVPRSQQLLFVKAYENGAFDFVKNCMRQVFTTLPANENYFWQLYFQGYYTKDCCPDYLKQENFNTLQEKVSHVNTNTATISEFLQQNPKAYSHYILLDHQDWLAENNRPALEEEWALILENSKKGTKILLRSAAETVDFFPDFVLEKVNFEKESIQAIHEKDRVGTYASTYLGTVI